MLRRLIEKFGQRKIDDPFFGRLGFIKTRDPRNSYWEGAGLFPATGTKIQYFVDGDETGPGKMQCEFYDALTTKYSEITKAITPLLAKEYQSRFTNEPSDDIEAAFKITSVSVPYSDTEEAEWEITFECAEDSQHLFTVNMRGWQPTGIVTMDG